jgi:hypothetical protein
MTVALDRKAEMDQDVEVAAMEAVAKALAGLDEAARIRVIGWATSRYAGTAAARPPLEVGGGQSSSPAGPRADFDSFAELFDRADPTTEKDKALVAAYWVQACLGQSSFLAQELNTNLKDLGHGVGNITVSLDGLKEEKPSLVLQLKKSGTTKQARKTYKLTQEGAKRVRQMIDGE